MFMTFSTQDSAPKANRFHVKSRRGCRSCKARKCDEKRPICGNCSRYFQNATKCSFEVPGSSVVQRQARPGVTTRSAIQSHQPSAAEREAWEETVNSYCSAVVTQSKARPCTLRSISDQLLDPFITYPATSESGTDMLLKYYFTTTVYMTFPWQLPSKINPTMTYYTPLIYTDKLLFRTILQHTAMQLEVLGSTGAYGVSQRLMGDSIKLLQEQIQDPGRAVSNETLAAVANLAAIEHRRGNLKALRTHIDGLRRMVAVRGGMEVLRRECAMVANVVFWIFVVSMCDTPFLPPDLGSQADPRWLFDAQEQYRDVPHLEFDCLEIDPGIAKALRDVRVLSQRYTLPPTYSSPMEAASVLTHLCRQLHCVLSPPIIDASSPLGYVISDACRHAIAIHVFSPWRGLHPDPTMTVNKLLHSLIAHLRWLTTSSINRVLLLWLLAVGGVAAPAVPERQWFVCHLASLVTDMELKSWEEMRSQLIKVIWHQRLCEDPHRTLWMEVVQKQKDLNTYTCASRNCGQ